VCIDPGLERPAPSTRALTVERLAPGLFDTLPDVVAGGGGSTGGLATADGTRSLSLLHGARLSHLVYESDGVSALPGPWAGPLADAGQGSYTTYLARTDLPFTPTQLVEEQDGLGMQTYLLGPTGGFVVQWAADGTSTLVAVDGGALDGISPAFSGALAWRGSELFLLQRDGTLAPLSDLGAPIAAANFGIITGFGSDAPFIVTSGQVWRGTASNDGGLDLVSSPLLDEDGGDHLVAGETAWAVAGVLGLVSGNQLVMFVKDNPGTVFRRQQACALCPPSLDPVWPSHCQSDAGVFAYQYQGCPMGDLLRVGGSRTWARRGPMAWGDAYGHFSEGSDSPIEVPPLDLSLGNVPALFELNGALVTGAGGLSSPFGRTLGPSLFVARTGEGWRGRAGSATFASLEIRNEPSWASVSTTLAIDQQGVVDLQQGAPDPWSGPVVAHSSLQTLGAGNTEIGCFSRTSTGGGWLASTNFDLLATSVVAPDGGPAVGRLAPFPALHIDSMALFPGDADAGTLVRGYVLSSAGVAYVQAFTERAWSAMTVDIPPGDWLELLSDDAAARVAYSDGRIVTLPSRLDSSERLPVSAYDFATYAGTDFALTANGLYRSSPNPDGGPLSTWALVPLPPGTRQPGYAANDFSNGHLLGGRQGLYLVTAQDSAFAVRFDGGTP
jgi:hypothetical protein